MAIDSENKRRSVACVLPVPDWTIGPADRRQVAWIYSGLLPPTVAGLEFTVPVNRLHFVMREED